MSMLFGKEVVLFPEMSGFITFAGEPASNAEIKVHIYWKDDIGEEQLFYADKNGAFIIPEKRQRVRIPALSEFVITQQITVVYRSNEHIIWSKSTMETDESGGLGGKIRNIQCELTNERKKREDFNGLFSTSCNFDIVK